MRIQNLIENKLLEAFSPTHLDVVNESHMHSVGANAESHFKVVIVSTLFEGQRLLQRHRAVNAVLVQELQEHIHALAMHTYTPTEWEDYYSQHVPLSPNCLGGSKKAAKTAV